MAISVPEAPLLAEPVTWPLTLLGIDPGLGRVGYGVVRQDAPNQRQALGWGLIETHKDQSDSARLLEIERDLTELVTHYQPDLAVVERIFYFRNATTMVPVCQARGVILLVLARHHIPVVEYTPMQIKQSVVGHGKASKQEVQAMICQWLDLEAPPKPDDAADALAMTICHASHQGW